MTSNSLSISRPALPTMAAAGVFAPPPRSERRHYPAIDRQDLAGDITAVIRAEEEGGPRDVAGDAPMGPRDAPVFDISGFEPVGFMLARAIGRHRHARA